MNLTLGFNMFCDIDLFAKDYNAVFIWMKQAVDCLYSLMLHKKSTEY